MTVNYYGTMLHKSARELVGEAEALEALLSNVAPKRQLEGEIDSLILTICGRMQSLKNWHLLLGLTEEAKEALLMGEVHKDSRVIKALKKHTDARVAFNKTHKHYTRKKEAHRRDMQEALRELNAMETQVKKEILAKDSEGEDR